MDKDLKNYHSFWFKEVKIVFLFLFVIAVFWYVSVYSRSVVPERSFAISGEGKVVAVPDIAEISVGILTEGGKNLVNLQEENTGKVNAVISFLKEEGIDEEDIKTQYYNISPRYQYFSCPVPLGFESRPCPPSEIIGYSISQSILVKIRSLEKVGDTLSGVVEHGANTVSGPNFTIDDPAALENEAREKAIKEAREKAVSMSKAGKFRLGKLISIQEGFGGYPTPLYFEKADGLGSAGPTIEPGSQEVSVSVTLTYEIK